MSGGSTLVARCAHIVCRFRTRSQRIADGCERGFTLIELMLVVTITGIVATIAVPGLLRARDSSVEASTIASLQMMNTAQASFSATCGSGLYAPAVVWLTKPPSAGRDAFIAPDFAADSIDREGYRIRFTAGPVAADSLKSCNGLPAGQAVQSYFISADPVQTGRLGMRYFGTSSGGTIYQSPSRVRTFYTGAPAAPAQAIP